MLRTILIPPSHMRLQYISTIQERHLAIRLHPNPIPRMRSNHVQSRDMEPKFPCLRELPQTRPQREQVYPGDGGSDVRDAEADVVDARVVEAEHVAVVLLR